ncbi:hypothetical protein CSB07_01315 [Candidatus Gracilibacteria bacterium]|nr:MAG: hypothetical protein CSB07_01315 [Candidatus Gracilibacteria bacterium]PIE85081.1 MAG: hypothetical protein CSA08_04020 [Candidatus Gracilibacteria bacterium]
MFKYKKDKFGYWISSDKINGEFGPFSGVFVKNKYLGNIDKSKVDELKYPGYKYSLGIGKSKLFIIGLNGIENIIN